MSLLDVKNISVSFGGIKALSDVSFAVEAGTIHSLIGPNGAGKTTLLNIISGIYPIQSGTISIDQKAIYPRVKLRQILRWCLLTVLSALVLPIILNIQSLWKVAITDNYIIDQKFPIQQAFQAGSNFIIQNISSWQIYFTIISAAVIFYALYKIQKGFTQSAFAVAKRGIARSFQNIRLFPKLTCYENILIALHSRTDINHEQEVNRLLELIDLKEVAQEKSSELAYGDQRRLEIARALAASPKLLLLDEPAAGMNPTEAVKLVELLKKIKASGITILLIEHNMKLVMSVSDKITVLNYGKFLAAGTPNEVRNNPRVIDAYLGKSENAE